MCIRDSILENFQFEADKDCQKILDHVENNAFKHIVILKFLASDDLENFQSATQNLDHLEEFYLNYAARFGSIKIVRYLLMNNLKGNPDLNEDAIISGNSEVIRLLQQNGVSYDGCLNIAISYHHHEICDWLIDNNFCEDVTVSFCLLNFNIRAAIFLIKNGFDINKECQVNLMNKKMIFNSLYIAIRMNWYDVVKCLIENGANVNLDYEIHYFSHEILYCYLLGSFCNYRVLFLFMKYIQFLLFSHYVHYHYS